MNTWTLDGENGEVLMKNGRPFAIVVADHTGNPLTRDEERELLEALNGEEER